MDNLISVIVPVYNVEKYLEKCVNSIIKQSYKNLEIILVDDGSTDNSGKICDEFALKDNRIKVIHKENGGLSSARNKALEIAKGEYIGFVDSDDYISEDMYETLYKVIKGNEADISIVSFYEEYNGKIIGVRDTGNLEVLTKLEAINELLIDTKIQSYAWNKLFKRELFSELEFPTGKNFEDIATTLLLFEKASKVVLLETPKYHYLRRDDSIVGVRNTKTYSDYLEVIYDKYFYLKGKYKETEIYNQYNYVINMIWVYTIIATFGLDEISEQYNKNYKVLEDIIKESEKEIIEKLDYYNKAVLYMILLNRDISKEAIKSLYVACKEKRNNGEFSLQI